MITITFYSYKGGTGRSLALANFARYLARLEFRVVALDLDLEAPGLHYKFFTDVEGRPPVQAGVADYIHEFVMEGKTPTSIKGFTLNVDVSSPQVPSIQLIPAGRVPSKEYWATVSRINWHDLFYSPTGRGVQVFFDLKQRISEELEPDFLLIDSRTGITEMGGVATTLLADKVVCLVLPTLENLEGTRAVLRSLRRSRRDIGAGELDFIVAASRLPEVKGEGEWLQVQKILDVLNETAEDLADSLSCSEIHILHSEARLQLRESLRVGGAVSPDESVLLRDYLRLFARVVPRELVEPKIGRILEQAKSKIWDDPSGATKEVEELAESFGRPEIYRELLRFYEVRNVTGERLLRRAQRLWDLTRDSSDIALWRALRTSFKPTEPWRTTEWKPDLPFVEAVWRDAGKKQADFGMTLADAYSSERQPSRSADVALEIIEGAEASSNIVARCIGWLDASKRNAEADSLIHHSHQRLASDVEFLKAWAEHAMLNPRSAQELLEDSAAMGHLKARSPVTAARLLNNSGFNADAGKLADAALQEAVQHPNTRAGIVELGELFRDLGRLAEFEKSMGEVLPPHVLDELPIRGIMAKRKRR
jgi:MinD-like ATPase involved in chromosome partitioning or flagellar assembly